MQRSTEGWQITLLRIKAGLAAEEAAIRPKLEIARSEEWIARWDPRKVATISFFVLALACWMQASYTLQASAFAIDSRQCNRHIFINIGFLLLMLHCLAVPDPAGMASKASQNSSWRGGHGGRLKQRQTHPSNAGQPKKPHCKQNRGRT